MAEDPWERTVELGPKLGLAAEERTAYTAT
jgi:hypothetical protein